MEGTSTSKHERLSELLYIYQLEVQHQESWLGRSLKFEKLDYFVRFEQKHSVEGIIRFRIDDLIFLGVLLALNVFFSCYNALQLQSAVVQLQPIVTGFQLYNIMMFVGSVVWLMLPHWYTKVGLIGLYVGMPALIALVFMNVLPMDPIDPATTMLSYLGYLTLPLLLLQFLLVYPLKQYIRNNIGSIYSMLYAYSVFVLLFLWPVHELVVEFVQNLGTVRLQFITNNIVIVYCLWAIVLVFVYLYIHSSLLSPSHDTVRGMLVPRYLTHDEMIQLKPIQETRVLLVHYKAYSRIVSLLIFAIFMGTEIYFLSLMIGYIQQLQYYNMVLMGFMIVYSPLFLIVGSWVIGSGLSNKWLFVVLSILAAGPSCAYPFIVGTAYTELSMLVLCVGPFTGVFWMVLRSIRRYQRILFLGILSFLYLLFYIPVILLTLNELRLFTTDTLSQAVIRYVGVAVMGFATAVVLVYLIIVGAMAAYKFITENQTKVGKDQTIDYDYNEEGECVYVPYTINKSLSLAGLTSANIKRSGYFLNSVLFLGCCLGSLYALQEVYAHDSSYFYSSSIKYVILSQFPMALSFYLMLQMHVSNKPFTEVPSYFIGLLVGLLLVSIALAGVSFIPDLAGGPEIVLRLAAITLFIIMLLSIGLTLLKNSNEQIHKFLSPVSALLIWFLLVVPFVEMVPIMSVFINQSLFGNFMYYVISGASALVILVVSVITLIFNALMNRFEEEKKMKYITHELKEYFNNEGVESDDVILHKFYESYEQRDHKYVYYLRNGYPLNLHIADDGEAKVVSMEEYKQLKEKKEEEKKDKNMTGRRSKLRGTKNMTIKTNEADKDKEKEEKRHCCLSFLDCLCGDDELLEEKVKAVLDGKQATQGQLEDMLPLIVYDAVMRPAYELKKLKPQNISNEHKREKMSTRTIVLNNLTETNRRYVSDLADQLKHNRSLRVETWHIIFDFFANEDYPPKKLIYVDLETFIKKSDIDPSMNSAERLYQEYAKEQWGDMWALNLEGFSLLVGDICEERVESTLHSSKSDGILLEVVFPNLCKFKEFREHLDQTFKIHRFNRLNKNEVEASPFQHYQQLKRQLQEKNRDRNQRYNKRQQIEHSKKFIDRAEQKEQKERTQSCRQRSKRNLITCCGSFFGCLELTVMYIPRKIKEFFTKKTDETLVRKKIVKPWEILSTESVKLIETVEQEYSKKKEEEAEYKFRHTFNNYLPALMKLLDLYYFVSLSIGDSQVDWLGTASTNISPNNGGWLYENYQIIMWVCAGLVVIYLGMSIKAVRYISQGRFGLTENGLPAGFPTPMFFFTTIYKLLSLSLFSLIMQTIYDTFDCTWFNPPPFVLFRDGSLQCLASQHDIFVVVAIVCMAAYYPISAYVSPNFQFAEKSLDLKYKPSYLVLFFQCKFILVAAQVLLTSTPQDTTLEIIYISVIIAILVVLAFTVLKTQPCLIKWFNYLDALLLLISLVVNACGLAIYLTGQRIVCIAVGSTICGILVGGTAWLLKAKFFSSSVATAEVVNNEELLMALDYTHKKHRKLAKTQLIEDAGVTSTDKLANPALFVY